MTDILLDRQGSVPVQQGYRLVTSDVEFLDIAVEGGALQIRGSLCDWAENFYRGRGVVYRELLSPVSELVAMCPTLSPELAEQAYQAIGQEKYLTIARPLIIPKVLNAISPCQLWESVPSRNHAADWLIWVTDFGPGPFLHPLLQVLCDSWASRADATERAAYSARDRQAALSAIRNWLGLSQDPAYKDLRDFPRAVPNSIKNDARSHWKKQIIETRGSFLPQALLSPMHSSLKAVLAEEAYLHFKKRQKDLREEHFEALAPFLGWQEQQELRAMLPPTPVVALPNGPQEILNWYRDSYLPYRAWQLGTQDADALSLLETQAIEFAKWYLACYPKALSSGSLGDYLNFARMVTIARNSHELITLVVVLDGLHVGDAKTLNAQLREHTLRLTVVAEDIAFTAIPTVTEFCKPALFAGVQPNQADSVQPLGIIIPENELPSSRLTEAQLGDVFLWRIQEPDHTYHSRGENESLLRKVEAELHSFAKIINDLVEQVPASLPLQIVITTDHGRLLGRGQRKTPVPQGMTSHGRAAWGEAKIDFGQSDYVMLGEVAFLKGERFGMNYDVATPLSNDVFLTADGRTGQEAFPHGGLYPEEIIVPWTLLVRDYVTPEVSVSITGMADAGEPGQAIVSVTNLADVDVALGSVQLDFGEQSISIQELGVRISGHGIETTNVSIPRWPTSHELQHAHCECSFRQSNGSTFTVTAVLALRTNEMYTSENVLEDLL